MKKPTHPPYSDNDWLRAQLEEVRTEVASWPQWKKDLIRYEVNQLGTKK